VNVRILMEKTPARRIAAAAVKCLRHFSQHLKREPDYADFETEIRPHVEREILKAYLEGMNVPPAQREAERRKTVLELGKMPGD
jgi:hypothetical protein